MQMVIRAGFMVLWFGDGMVQLEKVDGDGDRRLIVGIGNALVDILAHESDAFLEKAGILKGGMTLVDNEFIENTLALTSAELSIVAGGSACNTAVGIGKLGGNARFVGKCGSDRMGSLFQNDLKKQNVEPFLFNSTSPTGRCLSLITPDAQRSMSTYLGAAAETNPEEITAACFKGAALVHVEGYLLFNEELILSALRAAKQAGAMISLDLASYTVVEESRHSLDHIINNYVDILIANEDEAQAYTGLKDEEEALLELKKCAPIAVVKVGERGSYIAHNGRVERIPALGNSPAVDTTGAGDLWAAGFLFGMIDGLPMETCGKLASACGYEVCQVIGATIPDDGWQRIQNLLEG
jgi:sugar/nucleoside kinase (ribokinase family)